MTQKLATTFLSLIGWGFIIFGIVFVTIAFPEYDRFAHTLANLFDWTGGPHTEALTRDARWFAAIMSGLSAGFGAFYIFLIIPLLRFPNIEVKQIARRGGLISAVTWFVVDSTGSFAAGVPSNIAMNFIFLAAISVPLIMMKIENEKR